MSSSEFTNPEYLKPRMFTLNQIKDLVYLHLSRSELKRKVAKHDTVVNFHDNAIFEQSRGHKKLKSDMEQEFKATNKSIHDLGEHLDIVKRDYSRRFSDINRTLNINEK
jgi:hypothetical protein